MSIKAGELWDPIKKGVGNVAKSLKLGVKQILGTLLYDLLITFTFDEAKLRRYREKKRALVLNVAREYSSLWKDVVGANPELSAIAFLAAPGPYLSAYLLMNARVDLYIIKNFLHDAGVLDRKYGYDEDNFRNAYRDSTNIDVDNVESSIDRAINKVADLLELRRGSSIDENSGKEPNSSEDATGKSNHIENLARFISSAPVSARLQDYLHSSELIEAKKQQLKSYLDSLNLIAEFSNKIKNARSSNELEEAYSSIVSVESPLQINFKGGEIPGKVIKRAVEDQVNKIGEKERDALLRSAPKNPNTEKMKPDQVIKNEIFRTFINEQLRLSKEFINSEEYKTQLEEIKAQFIQDLKSGFSDDQIAGRNSEITKLIADGVEKIKNAGLLKK